MKAQHYISILLVSLFLVKFVAIDANGLNLFFSGSDIIFVNPNCKKEHAPQQSGDKAVFSQPDQADQQIIELGGYCTPQFQFELFSWETLNPETPNVSNDHLPSRLDYRYLENISPPPRQA